MNQKFQGWSVVAQKLERDADGGADWLNAGQRASLRVIADRIASNGLVLADEVGMGKTRIAVTIARAVIESGGRVAILIPPGLGFQWANELKQGHIKDDSQVVRSIGGYLAAWDTNQNAPLTPWFNDRLILISHAFPNWRLGATSEHWRWALLPTLYGEWRKQSTGRYPRSFLAKDHRGTIKDKRVRAAAESIYRAIPKERTHPARRCIEALSENIPWPGALEAVEYSRNQQLRPWLERAVGLGFGVFDLVIVDEAHKGRGLDSGLTRLLESIVLQSEHARRLAMTATPVELDVGQWQQTLGRISVPEAALEVIGICSQEYEAAVKRVRQAWRSSQEARDQYVRAAALFQRTLHPYLLRRDKREDEAVKSFGKSSGENLDAYRQKREIRVQVKQLSPNWRQAICAAESLSLVLRQADDPVAKRLRLTMGSGHAIVSLLDQVQADSHDQGQQHYDRLTNADAETESPSTKNATPKEDDKRKARADWWRRMIQRTIAGESVGLFEHPAILAAVEAIESYTKNGQKVIVFGRFTKPLRVLTELLNAREMLRCLQDGRSWPQSVVHSEEKIAIRVAHRQLKSSFDINEIDALLEKQYLALGRRRERLREQVVERIEAGLGAGNHHTRAILAAARVAAPDETRAHLARALDELLEADTEPNDLACAGAFTDLVAALRDRDDADSDDTDALSAEQAAELWGGFQESLKEEYGVQRGTFARMMYGETKLPTRRTLQLAFNRPHSFPRVLVAQSMVGREGLNLHLACRVVVLLHPEWNPGVVEQQIGRVDRVGSRWARELDGALLDGKLGNDLPRIEVCPVIFQDTYDEHHWGVLSERWDNLRAQLHGIVVPQSQRVGATPAEIEIIRQLDEAGPNFSPLRRGRMI